MEPKRNFPITTTQDLELALANASALLKDTKTLLGENQHQLLMSLHSLVDIYQGMLDEDEEQQSDHTAHLDILLDSYTDTYKDEAAGEQPASPITPVQNPMVTPTSDAIKYDSGKLRYDLVPVRPLRDLTQILTFGAAKYSDRNWEKGFKWSRTYAALQRHLQTWYGGEDKDSESGLSHLAHAACCIFFLQEFEYTHPELDDRVK